MAKHGKPSGKKIVADNRKARRDFEIIDSLEAGLSLMGTEVKSLRNGECTLREAYVMVRDGNVIVTGMHIPEYSHGNINNHEPTRDRQLLLHAREIETLKAEIERKGHTVVPLQLYFKRGKAKLLIGIAKGRLHHDKRQAIKKRDQQRQIDRELSDRNG